MSSGIFRKQGIIAVILILAAAGYWWFRSRPPKVIAIEHIADRNVVLWNTLAQVREPVAELHFGERVEVMRQEGVAAQVRTASGALGWLLDAREMMDSVLWEQSTALLTRARSMPVQARGQTKTVSNVRVEPGRGGRRIFQFTRGTPVLILQRTVAEAPPSNEENAADEKKLGGEEQKPKQEDWLFVLRAEGPAPSSGTVQLETNAAGTSNPASGDPVSGGPRATQPVSSAAAAAASGPAPPIAGWVLARFIELDLPDPVRDYASSTDLHVVAWFELNRVPDHMGGTAPQYLVAGARAGEGQACDFTMLRVYTWGADRKRYETAYVESDLCGRLPIQVSRSAAAPEFHFAEAGANPVERTYVMHQTVVRRVKNKSAGPSSRGH